MKNIISIEKKEVRGLNVIQQLALNGFLLGEANYGESVTGVSPILTYNTLLKGWFMTVFLLEDGGHTSTSGIGFYEKTKGTLQVYSSRIVVKVGITNEMRNLLNEAELETPKIKTKGELDDIEQVAQQGVDDITIKYKGMQRKLEEVFKMFPSQSEEDLPF